MNILVVGNGFDLAHGLPTKYSDFLEFAKKIEITSSWQGNKEAYINKHIKMWETNNEVREYVIKAFETRKVVLNNNTMNSQPYIQELYDNIKDNVWLKYFYNEYTKVKSIGIHWIDFESEIKRIIKSFDNQCNTKYDMIGKKRFENDELKNFYSVNYSILNEYLDKKRYNDLINKLENDLNCLIRCLEIYLEDCVGQINTVCLSPDIKSISIDNVLSFNYTNTYEKIYDISNNTNYHFIHGKTNISTKGNNMVLGINEYLPNELRNVDTDYIVFKKYYQRIIKGTGNEYRVWLKFIKDEYEEHLENCKKTSNFCNLSIPSKPYDIHNVYIFGHSLDMTDKDILKDLILSPNVVTTIFYKDKNQQSQQIANLVKVITEFELIERTSSADQSIIFKQQNDMIKE
ncbi:bacteriophage abortive infection AbiH family protein [Clostridiaceae bacterium UIB06]|uniref:Bacteriophage abortive infection AbiH family protein n=1 Tax=Clostridium thailandense TaxID=2794346 RepID=A0A949X0Y2_9CLOT|nr:bacteriophage abortive infection AbiH family protein [Clostridium thailandense]MBV7271639.1 bacteriophage abortive infection AbiH family protein [Clostridium thailandense]MCH5136391.1 bacteriophage abortive infection AbiH family protein [Clostridiaceae bacterium UIB06]